MDDNLAKHQLEEERRLSDIEDMLASQAKDLQNLQKDVKELVVAWQAASWIVSVVKGLGAIAVAIGAAYALLTGKQ